MTTKILIKLGDFKFSVSTAAFSELKRVRQFRWASQDRLGGTPSLQYTGEGAQTITIGGVIYTTLGAGTRQIAAIEALAAKGQPLPLVAGTGDILAFWVVTQIEQTDSFLFPDGVPRKQEFNLSLQYYGERYPRK